MVRIEINSGSEAGKVVELQAGTHTVGRHPSADFQLAVDSVSGRHLELTVGADGSVRFKDLGSTNGTFSGGVKVTDGEWFPGSELRLGNASLTLVDESAKATAVADMEADASMHARAREAAMSGGRKGGPMMLVLLLVLVGGAGAAYWFLVGAGSDESEATEANAGSGGAAVSQEATDLIDNLGRFAEADLGAWSQPEGVELQAGELSFAQAGRRVSLLRDWMAVPSLKISASASGSTVWPLIEWGTDGQEEGVVWQGAALGAEQQVSLPESATWMRLSLLSTGAAKIQSLTVEEGDGAAAATSSHDGRSWTSARGNGVLQHTDGRQLLRARSAAGSWTTVAGGLDFEPSSATLVLSAGEAVLDAPVLILNDGGPIPIADGVRVERSPGLLFGDGVLRLLIRFDEPCLVAVRDGEVQCQLTAAARLRWDITEDLTRTSSLARELKKAADDQNVAGVLSAAGQILRDYPFRPEAVQDALARSREVLQAGRATLADLTREKADAAFLQSVEDLMELEQQARDFAMQYEGTDLAAEALAEAEELAATAAFLRQSREVEAATYRKRLTTALSASYPLLSAWLRASDQS